MAKIGVDPMVIHDIIRYLDKSGRSSSGNSLSSSSFNAESDRHLAGGIREERVLPLNDSSKIENVLA